MATSDIKGDLHELITCAVCLDTYMSPRQLPCLHMFCLKCIQGLVKPGGAKIVCPLCRRELDLPSRGSDAFPVSFLMNSLNETFNKFESFHCVFCKEDGEERPGTWLCLQCSQTMCSPCKKHHKRALGHDIIECSTIIKESMQKIIKILKIKNQKCPTSTSTSESSKSVVEYVKKKADEYRKMIAKWEYETISKVQHSLSEIPQSLQVHVHFPSLESGNIALGTGRLVLFSKYIEFEVPHSVGAIALMHDGNLAICGWGGNWAAIYTQTGQLVRNIYLWEGVHTKDIECSPDAIYIADTAGQIHVYNYYGRQQPMLDKSLPKSDAGLSFHKGHLYVCSFKYNQIRKYDLSITRGKKWSYIDIPENTLNGPTGLKAMDDLLLVSNNVGRNVVGLSNNGDVIFRIYTYDMHPISVDCDSDGYVVIPTVANGKPVINLYDKQEQYIGCIQDILQGVVKPVGLAITGNGRLLCGCTLSESSFKVIGCLYQVIYHKYWFSWFQTRLIRKHSKTCFY